MTEIAAEKSNSVGEYGERSVPGSRNPESRHFRSWVAPPNFYDRLGASQFTLLTLLGLREQHKMLDIGCGSLSAGRLFVSYLRPGGYHGIEPEAWALDDGKAANLGEEFLAMKQPVFSNDSNFTLSTFGEKFDFMIANSIFTHAPARLIHRCLAEARAVMHKDSIFVATYYRGYEDHQGDEWRYPYETVFTAEFMSKAAKDAGLRFTHLDWPNLFEQQWFVVTDPDNTVDLEARLKGSEFDYESYLENGGMSHRIENLYRE